MVYAFASEEVTCEIFIAGERPKMPGSIKFLLFLMSTCGMFRDEAREHFDRRLKASLAIQGCYTSSSNLAALVPAILLENVQSMTFPCPDDRGKAFSTGFSRKSPKSHCFQSSSISRWRPAPSTQQRFPLGDIVINPMYSGDIGRLFQRTHATFVTEMMCRWLSDGVEPVMIAKR
jgi:hypothetical protein